MIVDQAFKSRTVTCYGQDITTALPGSSLENLNNQVGRIIYMSSWLQEIAPLSTPSLRIIQFLWRPILCAVFLTIYRRQVGVCLSPA